MKHAITVSQVPTRANPQIWYRNLRSLSFQVSNDFFTLKSRKSCKSYLIFQIQKTSSTFNMVYPIKDSLREKSESSWTWGLFLRHWILMKRQHLSQNVKRVSIMCHACLKFGVCVIKLLSGIDRRFCTIRPIKVLIISK